ncbi:MAG TPA: ATP-binding protein [Ignavibacteriaceae bacterium]|nr:ATP-binding protein [Ignavibacteriaceae bacterium]
MFSMIAQLQFFFLVLLSMGIHASSINLVSVKINNKVITLDKQNEIIISTEDKIKFNLEFVNLPENLESYNLKVFLNALLVPNEVNFDDNPSVEFNQLTANVYIFKVVAYGIDKSEIESPAISFTVKEPNQITSVEGRATPTDYSIYLIILIFILIAVSIYALVKTKKSGALVKSIEVNSKHKTSELEIEINKLQAEIKKEKDENHFLKKQILDLKENIINLQKSNDDLVNQNERLEKAKEQLHELQAEKEKLFAITLHDIKNPASAINGYIDLLNRYDFNAMEQQDILQSLAASSMQIISLSQKMSKVLIAKRKEEADELNLNKTSLKSIIDNVCKRNYAYAKSKNVELMNNASLHTPDVKVDALKIDEALDNYVSNAIKFSPENSVVKVSSYFSESKVFIEVTDNGPGLTKWDSDNAFQEGKTLSAKPTGGESSTGMGLWIVKQIVEQHGGEVWVKSKAGYGATFGFCLPII